MKMARTAETVQLELMERMELMEDQALWVRFFATVSIFIPKLQRVNNQIGLPGTAGQDGKDGQDGQPGVAGPPGKLFSSNK